MQPTDGTLARDASEVERPYAETSIYSPVLVIDDDPVVHDLMARLLAKEGLQVVSAFSGAEGLRARAQPLRPAAITLDVMMPGLDGWTVLTTLKADPELSSIPVVMVTMTDDRGGDTRSARRNTSRSLSIQAGSARRSDGNWAMPHQRRLCSSWTTIRQCDA